jgi:hypothetical protein
MSYDGYSSMTFDAEAFGALKVRQTLNARAGDRG